MFIFLVIATVGLALLSLSALMFAIWLLVEQFRNQREFDWLGLIATLCIDGIILIGLGLLNGFFLAVIWGWK